MEKIINENILNVSVIGVGTGKTVKSLIKYFPKDRIYVPSSIDSMLLLKENGLTVSHLSSFSVLDVYFDSADFYDKNENLLKGGGGSLVEEKLMMSMSKKSLILLQKCKKKQNFDGLNVTICILKQAITFFSELLIKQKLKYSIRKNEGKAGPIITDIGNVIFDIQFDKDFVEKCKLIPGVVEHGYFEKEKFNYEIYEF